MVNMKMKIGSLAVLLAFVGLGCSDEPTQEDTDGTGGSTASGGHGGEAPAATGGAGGSDSDCGSADDMTPHCREVRRAACAPLEEAECEADRFCSVLKAQKLDDENDCKAEQSEIVGCGLIGCTGAFTVAEDDGGVAWVFPSGCLPLGWTEVDLSDREVCTE